MPNEMYRIGIVGATTLAGKELSDELQESLLGASEFVLLDDDEDSAGLMTAAGDEAAFVQRIDAGSFERMDFVFFAGDRAGTEKHWQQARQSGASIVDLTYALEGEHDVLVRSPLAGIAVAGLASRVGERSAPDLKTPAVVAAHPAAVMLALVAGRLGGKLSLRSVAATVLEPASEHGRLAMDELHQQTVNLLSFQPLPKEQFDSQVSFNLVPELGGSAKVNLAAVAQRVRAHYEVLGSGGLPSLALQVVLAPVFHGYVASVLVEFEQALTVERVEGALTGTPIEIAIREADDPNVVLPGDDLPGDERPGSDATSSDPPSNVSAAGQANVMVRVSAADAERGGASKRFWLWLAADNLKLTAVNAISCALELRRLRPSGKVQ